MERLIFAFVAAPGPWEAQALSLTDSIRTFGGRLSSNPIWVLVPHTEDALSAATREKLRSLSARLIPFQIENETLRFPFAVKAWAAAVAEVLARGQTEMLVWMDRHALVLDEPQELLLSPGKSLGYRPVDHTLIGSSYDEPLDPFWTLVYEKCGVMEDRVFPMVGSVDENRIRPYFNAGMLAVRPEKGLLQQWRETFERWYREPAFEAFYQQDDLYAIFVHQAVLSGTLLVSLEREAMHEFSYRLNYPLHMHDDYPRHLRPTSLNELISCRYESFFRRPDWRQAILVQEPLLGWLDAQSITQPVEQESRR